MNRNSTEWVTRAVYDGLKEEIETLRAELDAAERAVGAAKVCLRSMRACNSTTPCRACQFALAEYDAAEARAAMQKGEK